MGDVRTHPRFVIVQPDPLIGRVVADRFAVQRRVARGSSGRVYRAEQVGRGRPVALKTLDGSAGDFDLSAARLRFQQEGQILAQLSHPNTVRVIDAGTWEGVDYLAMEFVEGRTLKQVLADGPLAPRDAVSIARQICGSLREAHDLGVVHRDLKPGNVLLTPREGNPHFVKVVDFGLVKRLDGRGLSPTLVGRIVGSPLYMAPEQIRGEAVDGRTDLYALGAVLFHMLTGARPFPQDSTAAVLVAHLMNPPPSPAGAAPDADIPPALDALVQAALAKDPAQRPASAAAFQAALDHIIDILEGRAKWTSRIPENTAAAELLTIEARPGAAAAPPAPTALPAANRRPRWRTAAAAAAAAGLLVLGGVGAGYVLQHTAPGLDAAQAAWAVVRSVHTTPAAGEVVRASSAALQLAPTARHTPVPFPRPRADASPAPASEGAPVGG